MASDSGRTEAAEPGLWNAAFRKPGRRNARPPLKTSLILKKTGGFSLIELLVVTALIGILSAVAIPGYLQYKKNSYEAWVVSNLAIVAKHLELARSVDGGYHQFIGHTGYVPRGQMYGNISFAHALKDICCNKYPEPDHSFTGAADKAKNFHKYSYLRKVKTTENYKHALDAKGICSNNPNQCSPAGDKILIREFGRMEIVPAGQCTFKKWDSVADDWDLVTRKKSACDCRSYLLMGGTRYRGKEIKGVSTGTLRASDDGAIFAIDQGGQLCKVDPVTKQFKPHRQ